VVQRSGAIRYVSTTGPGAALKLPEIQRDIADGGVLPEYFALAAPLKFDATTP